MPDGTRSRMVQGCPPNTPSVPVSMMPDGPRLPAQHTINAGVNKRRTLQANHPFRLIGGQNAEINIIPYAVASRIRCINISRPLYSDEKSEFPSPSSAGMTCRGPGLPGSGRPRASHWTGRNSFKNDLSLQDWAPAQIRPLKNFQGCQPHSGCGSGS